jgi:hypothetical protein
MLALSLAKKIDKEICVVFLPQREEDAQGIVPKFSRE